MKNKLKFFQPFVIVLFIGLQFILSNNVNAQCAITASAYPIQICKGEPVNLTASGACGYLMLNDFNNGTIGLGWYSNAVPMFNNPCPPLIPPASGIVCWIGSAASYPRELTTISYNLAIGSGYTIDWDMKYGDISVHANCEDPDQPNEGVHLQYSTVGPLGPWTDINYWAPNATISGPLFTWGHYNENVPTIAWTPNTQFRWYQAVNSTNAWDHWGIDNVEIKASSGLYANVYWQSGNNPAFADSNYSLVTYPDSTGWYLVTIDDSVYMAQDTVYVEVYESPSSEFQVVSPICSDFDTTILEYLGNAPPSADFYWTASNGLQIPPGPGPHSLSALKAGNYTIMLNVNNHGCPSDVDTSMLVVNQKPLVSFAPDNLKGCDPVFVNFKNNTYPALAHYTWDFGDGSADTMMEPSHSYIFTGDSAFTVSLHALTDAGCEGEYTIKNIIEVYEMPVADYYADPDSTNLENPLIAFNDLSTGPITQWNWDFGNGATSIASNPTYEYEEGGDYKIFLEVITENGCQDTISGLVKIVEEMDDSLVFPNVFTPNGDGINEYFEIKSLEDVHYLYRDLVVFNRWGKKVYEKSNYLNEWDGEGIADGTYYYVFRYTFVFSGIYTDNEISGSITILR